ncbi:GNAT family N-acetyltransferase [Micromonosporaceae bacterium DT194]|uniref:GNAT family N-acetyltransferase n=1 Tax=Melissospora conviva TaxID=3388432 RepID=UPI003C18CE10
MTARVQLAPLDEESLEPLLSVAAAEAQPEEVMPPVSAPAGWSQARREAFRVFHRLHFGGLGGPTRTQMYAVVVAGAVVGMIRLCHRDEPGAMETGLWLGRSARGQGIGRAALRELLFEAARHGAHAVHATTTSGNTAALALLRDCGARLRSDDGLVHAEIRLPH